MRRSAAACGFGWLAIVLGVALATATPTAAQDAADDPGGVLNLFFDCQGMGCYDEDFFRREISVVNWVRDREVSDVHVLVTSEGTGGGGRLHNLTFIGRRAFLGEDQVLTVSSAGDATTAEQRQVIADRLKLGLVRYLVNTSAADQLSLTMTTEEGGDPESTGSAVQDDPWDSWVFRLGGNGFLNGESSYSSSNYSVNTSANRTTDAWKFNLFGNYRRNTSEFVIDDDSDPVVSLIEEWNASALLVKSLGPQWSVGVRAGTGRSSRLNEDRRWNFSPGIEYDFVPYSESSRRSYTLQALLNLRHWNYTEETIYFETSETRLVPSLTASMNQVEQWGRANLSVTGSQHLHDRSLYQVSVDGSIQFRLFRGFSINVGGFYGLVRDQIYLPGGGGATTEEILLRQQQLETSYNYYTSFGISYQFGSIFNNVVNPRFGGGGGNRFFPF